MGCKSKAASELKALRTFRRERLAEIEQQNKLLMEAQQQMERLQQDLQQIETKIDNLISKEPVVTEHAMLRYLERVEGLDMEELRRKVMSPEMESQILIYPNCKLPINENFQAVVRNRQVVTVEPKKVQQHRVRKSKAELIAQRGEYVE